MSKRVPKLRFPEFKNDGEWEANNLKEILIKNSIKNKDKKYSLVQSVSNKHGFINQDEYFENRRIASKDISNYYVIKKGYFAYNPSRIDVGSLAYKFDDETSIISPLYVSFKANKEKIVDRFLLNWFFSEGFTSQMIFEGGVRNTLNYENLILIKINLPSIQEQQKIAECLSSLDELIEAQNQKVEALKQHKKGLMQQLFPQEGETVPKLRFPEFKNDGEWEEKRLEYIGNVVASGDLDSSLFSEIPTDKHIYPVYSNSVSNKGLYGYYITSKYSKDSITITARGTLGVAFTRETEFMGIGRLLIVSNLKPNVANFIKELWNCLTLMPLENGGIPQLTAIKAKQTILLVPNPEEQEKIADFLSSLDELIETQTQKVEALKQHKKGLMQQLFPSEEM
jgi:type I restriction enzyme, S subunit